LILETAPIGDDWFRRFQEGEELAFRQIFDKYYRPISYFATKILNDDRYSEDIVSETFQKAWERRDRFATRKHLENFLYLVTRNGCISHLRSLRVSQSTDEQWVKLAGADFGQEGTALDLERVQAKLIEAILTKMEQLPGGHVLRMSYIEGKSTREIADELDISENNVYIIKSRSLKALRSILTNTEWMFFVLLFLRF